MKRRSLFFPLTLLLLISIGITNSDSLAGVMPYFKYCNVASNTTPTPDGTSTQVSTLIRAEVYTPNQNSTIQSITVTGPTGFSPVTLGRADYDATSRLYIKKIANVGPVVGEYTFTVTDSTGDSAKSYYRVVKVAPVPVVNSSTLVASGAMPTPTLSWSNVNYANNLLFKAVVYDSDNKPVWTSEPTGKTSVDVPQGKLTTGTSDGTSYKWGVIAVDDPNLPTTDNQSESLTVSLTVNSGLPGFLYTSVCSYVQRDGEGGTTSDTLIDTRMIISGGNAATGIASVRVTGPGGFDKIFTPLNSSGGIWELIPGLPQTGIYTFTLTTAPPVRNVVSYAYVKCDPLPILDEATFQASGTNPLRPRLTWSAPDNLEKSVIYAVTISDTDENGFARNWIWGSRAPSPSITVPGSANLQNEVKYVWRVDVVDKPYPYQPTNGGRSDWIPLELDNTRPNFLDGASVYIRESPDGIATVLDAFVNDPSPSGLGPMTVVADGPPGSGLPYTFNPALESDGGDLVLSTTNTEYVHPLFGAPLPDGNYSFTIQYGEGQSVTTYDWVKKGTEIPMPSGKHFQVTGNLATPTISWPAVSGYPGHLYYRLKISTLDGYIKFNSPRLPYTSVTLLPEQALPPGDYKFRVEVQDDSAWAIYNNRSQSDWHELEASHDTIPDAPAAVSAVAGNARATVSFDPPFNGGSPITSYTVTSNPGGKTASGSSTSLVVTGLTNGTAYTFKVTATNAIGTGPESDFSNSVTPATVPGAPTGVAATAGNGQATVSFLPPTSNGGGAITSYTVTSTPGGKTASGPSTSLVVTGLTNGTAYTFKVTATNAIGAGPASSASNSVTPATVPGAPTGVTATAGNGQATVSFTPPASNGGVITSYTVTSSPEGKTASGASTSLAVTGLTNGTAYTFTVTATNWAGAGPPSNSSNSVTPMNDVPGPPTGVAATPGNGQAKVSFSAPAQTGGSTITSYTVTANPGGRKVSGKSSPITVTGLANGTEYSITVTATNAKGKTGPASSPPVMVTPATVPGAPKKVTAAATGQSGELLVSFVAPASGGSPITSYTVATSTHDGKPVKGKTAITGVSSPIKVTGLVNGQLYKFTVKATNVVGTGAVSAPSVLASPATVPGAPRAVKVVPGNAGATITCIPPASDGGRPITLYTVTAEPGGKTVSGKLNSKTKTVQFVVTRLTNGTEYTFRVKAKNNIGYGPESSQVKATPVTVPGMPTGVSATAGRKGQAIVSFTMPASNGGSPIVSYTVTSTPGGKTARGSASPITVKGLSAGKYKFKVTATNKMGAGKPSVPSNQVNVK